MQMCQLTDIRIQISDNTDFFYCNSTVVNRKLKKYAFTLS